LSEIEKVTDTVRNSVTQLSGDQLSKFANNLVSGNLHTLLDRREQIISLNTDELRKLIDLGRATRAGCGGIDCG